LIARGSFDRSDEIRELEEACLDPEIRSDPERLAALIADDFQEFGSSGRVWDKTRVLDEVPAQSGLSFSLSEFAAVELAPQLVHTTFRLSTRDAGAERHSLRSSLWISRSGRWQMLFHQGTPCDASTA
jgi:hypothetical protein